MYRVIIWGTSIEYSNCLRRIKTSVESGELEVVGVTSRDTWYRSLDGFPFLPKSELLHVPHDYVLVASKRHFADIQQEYDALGGKAHKVLSLQALETAGITFPQYVNLYEARISLIANNCWGGVTYHAMHLPFLSPFINMFVQDSDYIALLQDLKGHLAKPLQYVGESHDLHSGELYPIFSLGKGGVQLHMNHYPDHEQAVAKWNERRQRINFDNLFVMMYTENLSIVEQFDALPYAKKVCFTPFPGV